MKKIIALIVLALLLFSVSCASSQENAETVPEFHTEYETDLSGMVFRFGSGWITQFNPAVGFSSDGDKKLARYRDLEEKLGVELVLENWENSSGAILTDIAANLKTIDILDACSDNAGYDLYKAGVLAALDDIETIDLSNDKWGTEAFRQYGIFDGKSYGFYQYRWEFMPEFAGTLLFNGNLLATLGGESPYEFQEAKLWKWENFRNILQTCADNADPSSNILPMTTVELFQDVKGLMFTNGCQMVTQDADGNYKLALDAKAQDAVNFLKELYDAGLYHASGIDPFTNETAVFAGCESWYGTHHQDGYSYPADVLENLGLLSMPYGPNGNPDLASGFVHKHRRLNWVIAYSGNDIDDIGTVIDFIFEPFDDNPDGWRSEAESRMIFHHDQDFENFCYLLDNINYDYSVQCELLASDFYSDAVMGRKSITEVFESLETQVQSLIDENMNHIK